MLLLNSMTDAPPQTRLMLITWMAYFGTNLKSPSKETLVALGFSKSHIAQALEYLVREGFLWKSEHRPIRPLNKKARSHDVYEPTKASLDLWWLSKKSCSWEEDLKHVLGVSVMFDISATAKASLMNNLNARLVLAVLIMKTDQAGYVIGYESQLLAHTLGMTQIALWKVIEKLACLGALSICSRGVEVSSMFGKLPLIFKIHPQRPDRKVINFGFGLHSYVLYPIKFIRDITEFYNLQHINPTGSNRNLARKIYLKNVYDLNFQDYDDLSKMVNFENLPNFISHLCLSIILRLISDYPNYSTPGEIPNDFFSNKVRKMLAISLSCEHMLENEESDQCSDNEISEPKKQISHLQDYMLNELSKDVVLIISEISKRWHVIMEHDKSNAQIVGYLPNVSMFYKYPEIAESEKKEQSEIAETPKAHADAFVVHTVLQVQISPNSTLSDCMLFENTLSSACSFRR